jgi:MFS family permease
MTDLDAGIIGWESQDDPELPYNFSSWHKWTWVWLLSAITLLTPFATSILSPAINIVDKEFDNPDAFVGSMTVSIYLFGYVVGPIFIGPLSEIYGRKPVLSAANSFFCLWQLGCALAPNLATLIVARFFSGVGGAACLTLGGSIIGDMFRSHERGFAIGMWNLGPLFGTPSTPNSTFLSRIITDCRSCNRSNSWQLPGRAYWLALGLLDSSCGSRTHHLVDSPFDEGDKSQSAHSTQDRAAPASHEL